jgi:hypothetical protein
MNWGVFLFNPSGHYFARDVVKAYKAKGPAYRHADKLNATLNDGAGPGPGEGYVVRSL